MGENYKDRIKELLKFKKVPGYQCEINRFGEVNSVTKKDKNEHKKGYCKVSTKLDNGFEKIVYTHILVALAWIGSKPSKKHQVNHKDLDKSNNYYKNLEWCTCRDNMLHAVANNVKFTFRYYPIKQDGENNSGSKLTWEQVIDIRFLYSTGLYTMKELAKLFHVSESAICLVVNYKNWK